MKGLSKKMIDSAFRESFIKTCICSGISLFHLTLVARIIGKGKLYLQLCRKDVPQLNIAPVSMLTEKMIALRLDAFSIEKLFRVVHHAFMKELKHTDPKHISLVLYESSIACCACIGVMEDEKPVKVLMVSDILQAMELGSEQLN